MLRQIFILTSTVLSSEIICDILSCNMFKNQIYLYKQNSLCEEIK